MAENNITGNNSSSDSPGNVSEEEDEAFEDAPESMQVASEMDLGTSIQETNVALNLFLNNKFDEAKNRCKPWADQSMYHALGYGTILYMQATLTFEMVDIEAAITTVKRSVQVCDRIRKKTSLMKSLGRSKINYDEYTDEQCHAELCYAECLMERALLTFVSDENLISFVKGSLKIRACHISYKECLKILTNRTWTDESSRMHFESGVRMGIGIFNLMLSLLPTKILKLLEFVGFSGNKKCGLSELEAGAALDKAVRGPLCSMVLLSYHTVMTYVLGTADGDIELAERLLRSMLQKYPRGALMLFFAARIEEIKGNLDEAVAKFEESIAAQSEWRQFHHLCYWELMWCHSFRGDWLLAMKYAERLCKESRWSRATYAYQKATFLMICADQTEETEAHIEYLMGEVPRLKQRIAGKSIPIEKFAVKKAKRYQEQNKRLTLPALELIYVWNGFMIIGKKPELLKPILTQVEETINTIIQCKDDYPYYDDDYCLALLLKGVVLKHSSQDFQAEQCFREVWQNEKKLKSDTYLIPYALMEMALLFMQSQNYDEAANILQKAKHNYKGYALESRLHFRIHAASLQLKALMNPEESDEASPPDSPSLASLESPTPPPSP